MSDNPIPFVHLDLERAIAFRWTLPKAERTKLSPVSGSDLASRIDLGLIEMSNNGPVLTENGHDVLD
jgi:hypothetical protein